MKHLLDRLFSCTDDSRRLQDLNCTTATLTSSLYSVIFVKQNSFVSATNGSGGQVVDDKTRAKVNTSTDCYCVLVGEAKEGKTLPINNRLTSPRGSRGERGGEEEGEGEGEGEEGEEDWIIIESSSDLVRKKTTERKPVATEAAIPAQKVSSLSNTSFPSRPPTQLLYDMALNVTDIDLIRASWINMRKDPLKAGLLLFEGLFTKFPQYLNYFPAFADLNLGDMHEHKLLKRHATKVIDTVTFVVDSVGDSSKADKLNEALVGLVKGHLKRNVGLAEFRNLGIVLIDFICNINQRGSIEPLGQRQELDGQDGRQQEQGQLEQQAEVVVVPNNKLDINAVVAAWTKLYASILDIVKREAGDGQVDTAAAVDASSAAAAAATATD